MAIANPHPTTTTTAIAAQRGETAPARTTMWRTIRTLGPERAHAFVTQALEAEANGGMLISDGSRRRTLGGIFFYLVRTQISDDEAMQINRTWRWQQWKHRQPNKPKAPTAPAPPPLPLFVWEEVDSIIAEVTAHPGDTSTVNVTVIGRPNQVVERQGVVILALRSTKAPTLPKGVPPLPATPTTYMIVVQQKQWNKVREAMQNADDMLIVEGYGVHAPRFTGITVYATQVTTKALHAAKHTEQTAAAVNEG
jgi:hypothetical protein